MAYSRVGTTVYAQTAGSGATTATATISSTSAGDLIVIGYAMFGSVPTWSSNLGALTVSVFSAVTSPTNMGVVYVANCAAGITSITATQTFQGGGIAVSVYHDDAGTNAAPADVSQRNDNGFGAANPQTSNATATLSATTNLVFGFGTQWRGVASVSLTALGSFSANGTQLASSVNAPGLAVADILSAGSTTGIAFTANASSTTATQCELFVCTFKVANVTTSPDRWHPEIQRPDPNPLKVVGY